jgi:hypothetical protein
MYHLVEEIFVEHRVTTASALVDHSTDPPTVRLRAGKTTSEPVTSGSFLIMVGNHALAGGEMAERLNRTSMVPFPLSPLGRVKMMKRGEVPG